MNDKKAVLDVVLREGMELSEVQIVSRKLSTLKLRSSVMNEEIITSDELCRAACCNLGESFVTNPSVDVSYSDAATGAKQIKLLGLSGTYVQMLTENIPNYRGAASPYGLGYVPGPWMHSIQVSKGISSVKTVTRPLRDRSMLSLRSHSCLRPIGFRPTFLPVLPIVMKRMQTPP